ncbi:hypothetical protein GCM10022236_29230 [Microlunatus ginsengisoli]|uniref:RNA polymerase sigma factor, sigma-70 family n=2 Tax=Microlunatus ginsengisoli TaxID=363863 RepID=A0ABP7A560_9ACTN
MLARGPDLAGPTSAMSEPALVADLVARARAGDQQAWNGLVDEFLPLVTAVIRRMRLPAVDADDVNQTVWLRLVEHLDDIREPLALAGWLSTVTRNEALRAIRARSRTLPFDLERSSLEVVVEDLAGDALIQWETHEALLAALDELPEKRRELLRLLLAEPPLSYREISARLGIPIGYIGPTRARALAQLRDTKAMRAFVDHEEGHDGGGGRDAAMG